MATKEVTTKRKPGRPRKSEIEKAKKPGKVGRPPGQAARIAEFKARLVVTDGPKIISKIIEKALNDNDPDQAAMLKMCFDRVLPMSSFEDNSAKPLVSIAITPADPTAGIHAQQRLDARRKELAEMEDSLVIEEGITVQVASDD